MKIIITNQDQSTIYEYSAQEIVKARITFSYLEAMTNDKWKMEWAV